MTFVYAVHLIRMTVTLFIPCFIDALFPRAGISMVQILEQLGHKVVCPGGNHLLRPAALQFRLLGRSPGGGLAGFGKVKRRRSDCHRLRFLRRDAEKFLSAAF